MVPQNPVMRSPETRISSSEFPLPSLHGLRSTPSEGVPFGPFADSRLRKNDESLPYRIVREYTGFRLQTFREEKKRVVLSECLWGVEGRGKR